MHDHRARPPLASASRQLRCHRHSRDAVLCGIHAIQEALHVETRQIERIWVAEGKRGKRLLRVIALAARRGTPIETVAVSRLMEVAGTTAHQGLVAFVAAPSLLPFEQVAEKFAAPGSVTPLVILDGVKDPRNLGAVIRSAAAFGIGGVIVPKRRAVGLTATVAKAAAGGLEHVAVAEVTNLSQSLEHLKRLGFWIVGTDEQADISCRLFAFPTPLALVLGEEGFGISQLVKRHCDALVRIPVGGPLHSLNVAAAATVLFYEVMGRELRQAVASLKPMPASPL